MCCNPNGEWQGTVPKCKKIKCNAPVIENGRVDGDRQEYNKDEWLTFRCNHGFKKVDDRPSKCQKLGQRGNAEWAPTPACIEITCELSQPPPPGTAYSTQNSVFSLRQTVRVTCGERYWIINTKTTEAVVTCKVDREWDTWPVCKEVTCSRYLPEDNLSWGTTRDTWGRNRLGDTVNYGCARNYERTDGAQHATCTRDGWTPKPLCRVTSAPCPHPDLENADITYGVKHSYNRDDQVRYRCQTGNGETFTATCREGAWTESTGCAASCPPPDFQNAVIIHGVKYNYFSDDEVQYRCKSWNRETFTAVCKEGTWAEAKKCAGYCENLEDGKLTIWSDVKETYMEGESINYKCDAPGEVIEGTASCNNGSWSKSIECPAASCLIGDLPTHLGIAGDPPTTNQVPGGQRLRFYCPDEYYLEGAAEIECSEAGEWKELFPTCSKKCPILVLTDNVIISKPAEGRYLRRKGEILTFGCQGGISITGHTAIECLNGGLWSGDAPTCENHSGCGRPPSLTDGDTVGFPIPPYEDGATVEYTCFNMYVLKGGRFKTCNNGVWTGEMICMKPCTVNAEMMERHNIEFSRNHRHKNYARHEHHLSFVCKRGTTLLHQEPMRKQCINGQMDLPTCG
uniref:Complement factor H-related 3 n=1 Tax=Nothobranchius pienaari TaxID=704102 RepID=A0A1A8MFE6_9TELE